MAYNILDFGARAEEGFINTSAIQEAIDHCFKDGGGQVVIPKGDFLCGGLTLKSHVQITLQAGAVLRASTRPEDYNNVPGGFWKGILLYGSDEDDISIDGCGTILGPGKEDWGVWWGIPERLPFRVSLLKVIKCNNFRIMDVTFLYSCSWTIHLILCENVKITGVRILNNYYHLNSDGIDPDSCKNVIISNCHIIAGDDCIVPKTTQENAPMENLVVSNCILESPATAIKIGTESRSDFRDIHFTNCTIKNSSVGLGIFVKDGATVERVTFTNMTVECANREHIKPIIPLYIDIDKREDDSKTGRVRDIIFQNIQVKSGSGALFQGMPSSHIENLTLADITFRSDFKADYSIRTKAIGGGRDRADDGRDTAYIRKPAYLAIAHVDGLTVRNVTVAQEGGAAELENMSALYLHDVKDADITAVRRTSTKETKAPVIIED
ncbi:MAG: glycoside hydrolase family 28 protein [Christensenellales bacterium]|jgi:polygalacturonase